jgi:radical SAM protein with 4Fe4S-binding SPASM domain
MDAGLNVLALDDYQHANIVPRIREAWYGDDGTPMYRTYEYPRDRDGNPHARRGYTEHDVVFIEAIDIAKGGTHASLNNHCGAAAPLNESAQGKKCAKPFRELSVRWDGAVAVCCNDWRGVMEIGNVNEVGHIDEIWQHPAMGAIRRHLYHGMRTEGPCRGCDALSYRPGLLPDRKGLEALPQPTDADRATVRAACAGAPMTLPVLREWETVGDPTPRHGLKTLARKS